MRIDLYKQAITTLYKGMKDDGFINQQGLKTLSNKLYDVIEYIQIADFIATMDFTKEEILELKNELIKNNGLIGDIIHMHMIESKIIENIFIRKQNIFDETKFFYSKNAIGKFLVLWIKLGYKTGE